MVSTKCFAQRPTGDGIVPYDPKEVDILDVHVSPEDAWYIIPVKALEGRVSLRVYPGQQPERGRYGIYRDAWHFLG